MRTKPTGLNGKYKRSTKGSGRIYKRGPGGREYSSDSNIKAPYWIAYTIPNPSGGKGQRVREPLRNEDGKPITGKKAAEAERLRILAPFKAKNQVESLRQIHAKLQDATLNLLEAEQNASQTIFLAKAWDTYLSAQDRPDSGDSTLEQYAFQWNTFARWMAINHPEITSLRDITPNIAKEYTGNLTKSGRSAGTFNKHIRLIKLVFRILSPDAGITVNPWNTITTKKQIQQSRRELTTDELVRITTSATGEFRLLLMVGIYTGLRMGDCCTLRWNEIDLRRRCILRVPNKTARSNGKIVFIPLFRDLSAMLQKARQTSRHTVYVMPEMADLYKNHRDVLIDRIQQYLLNCGIDCHKTDTGHQIMRDSSGNPMLTEHNNVRTAYTGKRAVVDVGFHSLRHTFVTLCRERNIPLAVVEAIVGHSNPTLTRVYTHMGETILHEEIDKLPSFLKSCPEAKHQERIDDKKRIMRIAKL